MSDPQNADSAGDATERRFAELAVKAGFVTVEQIERMRAQQAALAAQGKPVSLAGLCLRQRVLNPEMTATLLLLVDGVPGGSIPPAAPLPNRPAQPIPSMPPAPSMPPRPAGGGAAPPSSAPAVARVVPTHAAHAPHGSPPPTAAPPQAAAPPARPPAAAPPPPPGRPHPFDPQEGGAVRIGRAGEPETPYDRLPPVVYDREFATATHVRFLCYHCETPLALPWGSLGAIVECHKCRREMRLVSRSQREQEERRARERKVEEAAARKAMTKRLEELRRSGTVPPDQIAILGRPSSGKSVYLAVLYHQLWTSADDLSGRAIDGQSHAAILRDFQSLRQGQWLGGTIATRKSELQIRFRGCPVTLSTMDYPGEVFQKVFFENRIDTAEQQALLHQVEACMGALLLVDPEHAMRADADLLDVEFSFLQVADHLSERGFGDHMLLLLTKRDRNETLVDSYGGPRAFASRHLPRLLRAHPRLTVVHLSSVPTVPGPDGRRIPRLDGQDLDHVRIPLRRLLTQVDPAYLHWLSELDRAVGQAGSPPGGNGG